jgi:N-acetyl sugar amidotransferase
MPLISKITLDQQLPLLPKEVVFCRNCVVSNQRPRTQFNQEGICNACRWSYEKDHIVDWDQREKELQELCDLHRSSDGSFDVVVPGSGGKDSGYVAHQLKERYGMHPLCVTWCPFEYTEVGWKNLERFVSSGFNNIMGQPDGQIHRNLSRIAFELVGDPMQPFALGQKAWAFHIASKFGVKLVMYGENGELEYGGSEKYKNMPRETPEDWTEEYYKGVEVDSLVNVGLELGYLKSSDISAKTLQWYKPPPPEEILESGCEMHWYSYYHKWVPEENYYYTVNHTGLQPNPEGRSEGTYTKYISLDDKIDGFHWYMGYIKFGMGRASRDAQTDIRRHHITRDEGVALTRRYDGEFPGRHFQWFLDYIGVSEEYFWEVCNFYRANSNVWDNVDGQWKLIHQV